MEQPIGRNREALVLRLREGAVRGKRRAFLERGLLLRGLPGRRAEDRGAPRRAAGSRRRRRGVLSDLSRRQVPMRIRRGAARPPKAQRSLPHASDGRFLLQFRHVSQIRAGILGFVLPAAACRRSAPCRNAQSDKGSPRGHGHSNGRATLFPISPAALRQVAARADRNVVRSLGLPPFVGTSVRYREARRGDPLSKGSAPTRPTNARRLRTDRSDGRGAVPATRTSTSVLALNGPQAEILARNISIFQNLC